MLTAARLREVLAYDPETGVFTWLVATNSMVKVASVAGAHHPGGYRRIHIDGRAHFGHRLAWLYVHGRWPVDQIDHINGERSDNRIDNLREASRAENQQNQVSAHSQNKCGLLGVRWYKANRRWVTSITHNSKQIHLGYFDTKEEAKEFRDLAAAMLHPFSPEARP